jgi:hypothetical protein
MVVEGKAMIHKTKNRAEHREEIKLALEYAKVVISLAGVFTIFFAGLQWRAANEAADETVAQRMTNEWRDHLKTFVEKPGLRPYFESQKDLKPDDPNTQIVLALADIRLDVSDAVLSYAAIRGLKGQNHGWRNTFTSAFRSSPVLCKRLKETCDHYNLIKPVAQMGCVDDPCPEPRKN